MYVVYLAFGSNTRHATMSSSPFSMKCETRLYYACLPSEEKGDMRNTDVYRIRCPCPKISVSTLSLATLSNFSKPLSALSLSLSSVAPYTAALPPSVLDPSPIAHHHLIPGLGARYHLVPNLGACRCLISDLAGDPLFDLSPIALPPPTFGHRCHLLPT
jgi:hypothetical protein